MRRPLVKRAGTLLTLSLLAACTTPGLPRSAGNQAEAPVRPDTAWPIQGNAVGRIGPDGGPIEADRGGGGTGAPAMPRTAERGIGGTGIVGVVTGFGSVFVNGVEIRYDDSVPVDIDGSPSSAAALRVGQLVAIQADGPATAPYARTISVRSAVIGRIDGGKPGSATLTIGGQAVAVPAGTWGASRLRPGDWVRVSGLRRADGTIVASRLDAAPAGGLSARGRVVRDGAVARVGSLVLPAPMAAGVRDGQFVTVSGDYAGGHGRVGAVAPDTMFPNPADHFGASANRLIVQAFVQVGKDSLSMNGVTIDAGPAVSGLARHDGLAIVSLERRPDGSYTAVGLRYAGYRGEPDQRTGDPSRWNGQTTPVPPAGADGTGKGPANRRLARAVVIRDPASTSGPPAISAVGKPPAPVPDPIAKSGAPDGPGTTEARTPVSGPAVAPSAADGAASPATSPVTGAPTVESLPRGPSPANKLISSKGRTGTGWASASAQRAAVWHARHRSRAVTLKGSAPGPADNLLTGAVTSVTTTGNGTAPPNGAASPSSAAPGSPAAGGRGTTPGESGDRQPAH